MLTRLLILNKTVDIDYRYKIAVSRMYIFLKMNSVLTLSEHALLRPTYCKVQAI